MRAERLNLQRNVCSISEGRKVVAQPGDAVIVARDKPRNLIIKCPCGCNDDIIVNLDPRAGSAWRIYTKRRGLSVYPSIWRESGCQSHFIISQNKISWCDYEEDYSTSEYESAIQDKVLNNLRYELHHFYDIAANIDEEPWLVLVACRDLVRKNLAIEGDCTHRGYFAQKSH